MFTLSQVNLSIQVLYMTVIYEIDLDVKMGAFTCLYNLIERELI